MNMKITTPEETSEPLELEGTSTPCSRKVKVVALLVGAPGVVFLFDWLYRVALRFDLLPETSLWPGGIGDSTAGWGEWAYAGAIVVIPLYFAFKIWLHPTLKNLRRVPFIAAFWCFFGLAFSYSLLLRFEWIDKSPGLLVDVRNLLVMLLMLGAYILVKKVMVLWLEMPELENSGLRAGTRRGLWVLYCFFLWTSLVPLIAELPVLIISIVIAIYVYRKGLHFLGLRTE